MAERRMISSHIVESDAFQDMSVSAQALYFHLIMNADNRGYVSCAKSLIRRFNDISIDHLKELICNKFLLERDKGIYLIKHWYIHNDIPTSSSIEESTYINDLSNIYFDENKAYTLTITDKKVCEIIKEGKKKLRKENKRKIKENKVNENKVNINNNTQSNYLDNAHEGENNDFF